MKPSFVLSLAALSAGLAVTSSSLRADDTPPPAAAPTEPQVSPADGTVTPPPQGHHHRMRPAFVLSDLTEKLSLTVDEQKTVGGFISTSEGELRALRGDGSLSQDDKRAKMRDIIGATRQQIRSALTPDQQKLFDALPRHDRGEKPAEQSPAPAPANP
jgi:hypothetical protein